MYKSIFERLVIHVSHSLIFDQRQVFSEMFDRVNRALQKFSISKNLRKSKT